MPSAFGQQAAKKEFARTAAGRAAKRRVPRTAREQRCQGTAAPWSQNPVRPVCQAGSAPLPAHTKMSNGFLTEVLENGSSTGFQGDGRDGGIPAVP